MKTKITELLGIRYPIVQGAMGTISTDPKFVAAACNAGGLGIIASSMVSPEGTREIIRRVRDLTDKPFGVNLAAGSTNHEGILDVMCEEKVPVFNFGRGDPTACIRAAKKCGARAIPTIGAVKHAVRAEREGADAVIVTGSEGAGHSSYIGTMVLIPAVVRAVKIPVVAGGGVAVAEQLVAALALGAEAIEMGTRLVVTEEVRTFHPAVKQLALERGAVDSAHTHHFMGRHFRAFNNNFLKRISEAEPEVKIEERGTTHWAVRWRGNFALGIHEGKVEDGPVELGEAIELIDDIPTMAELFDRMVSGAETILAGLSKRFAVETVTGSA